MSKATNQSLMLLSIVSGALKLLRDNADNSKIQEYLSISYKESIDIVAEFPESGKIEKNFTWMHKRMQIWESWLIHEEKEWSNIVLISVGNSILSDLLDKLTNPFKRSLVLPLFDIFVHLSDVMDREGNNFEAYERADFLIYKLYKLIDFQRAD